VPGLHNHGRVTGPHRYVQHAVSGQGPNRDRGCGSFHLSL
jgi:hypothetical protein